MDTRDFPPIHPGEILREDFLLPMGIAEERLADDLSLPPTVISEILRGKGSITAETALRLGRYFGMEPQFWLNLQSRHDLLVAEQALRLRLEQEVRPRAA